MLSLCFIWTAYSVCGASRRSSAAVQQQQRRRKSSSATKSSTKHSQKQNLKEIMKRPSLQLTWKDRFLLCIGWTDPAKLEARLREQMKENEMEKGRRKIEEEEEREQQPLLNGRRKTKGREKLEAKQQSVVLEEAEYSVPSGEEEEEQPVGDVEDETILPPKILQETPNNNKIDIRKKYLNGILIGGENDSFEDTSRLPSALSQGSNSSCSRVSNQQQHTPNIIVNK
ncbi:unnamed protein product [Meloidogyne enterolobii]|uniref:Uncharacterized protein n=1 Tax=Meloidogyne enterolobii TaxID=390850 RepID=A0ACB0ZFH7_MELEN